MIAAAIDKFVYVTVITAIYAGDLSEVFRAGARRPGRGRQAPDHSRSPRGSFRRTPQIEITTLADIPAGTGLGSSGSFTTALLQALYAHTPQSCIHGNWPSRPATSRSIGWANRSASRINISRHLAASPASPFSRTAGRASAAHSMRDRYRSRGQPAAVLHRLHPPAAAILKDQDQRTKHNDREHDRQPALREGPGLRSKEALEAGDLCGLAS